MCVGRPWAVPLFHRCLKTHAMARSDMFLKVTSQRSGVLVGESKDKSFQNQIEVLDWSWGMSAPAAMDNTRSRTLLRELRVVKLVDQSSTGLMSLLDSNDSLKEVLLSVRKASGDTPLTYWVLKLGQARITDYSVESGMSEIGAPVLTEHLTFAFKTLEISYTPQLASGGGGGSSTFHTETGAPPRKAG